MKIAIGNDHGAYVYKNEILDMLVKEGHEVINVGCDGPESVDYPDYARKVADLVVNQNVDCGILLCGTGIGISIAANKVKGIRCALCNDANILALGQRTTGIETAKDIVHTFLNTPFSNGERHIKRIQKIKEIEEKNL